MHKVALVFACFTWAGYGRRVQTLSSWDERSLEDVEPMSAFNPSLARMSRSALERSPRFQQRSDMRNIQAELTVNPESTLTEKQKENFMKYLQEGTAGGGWDNEEYLNYTKLPEHQVEITPAMQLDTALGYARNYEEEGVKPTHDVYSKIEELKAQMTPEEIQEVVDEVDRRFKENAIRRKKAVEREEERKRREKEDTDNVAWEYEVRPDAVAEQGGSVQVQEGMVTGSSYAALMAQGAMPKPAAAPQAVRAPVVAPPDPQGVSHTKPKAPEKLPDKDPKELREQYKTYLAQSLKDGRSLYPAVLDMITRLAQEKPPTEREAALVKELAVMERQCGLEIHTPFVDPSELPAPVDKIKKKEPEVDPENIGPRAKRYLEAAGKLSPSPPPPPPAVEEPAAEQGFSPPPPASEPAVTPTTPSQPVTSPPVTPAQLPPVAAPAAEVAPSAPAETLDNKDPYMLRQQYKEYLSKCALEGRQPQGAIVDLISQLAKEKPPTALEEADMKEIIQMEQQFGLNIHGDSPAESVLQTPPAAPEPAAAAPQQPLQPAPMPAAPTPTTPVQSVPLQQSAALPGTDEPLLMGKAADIVAGMSGPATAAAPAPAPPPAQKDPSAMRLKYKAYLTKCIQQGQGAEGGILDMITRLAQEFPPTPSEQADVTEIVQMEQQLGLAIHARFVAAPLFAPQPAPQPVFAPAPAPVAPTFAPQPAPQPAFAAMPPAAPTTAAQTAADSAAIARDALDRLVGASDITTLGASDREALLASLIRALSTVHGDMYSGAMSPTPAVPLIAPAPAPAPAPAVPAALPPAAPPPAAPPMTPSSDDLAASLLGSAASTAPVAAHVAPAAPAAPVAPAAAPKPATTGTAKHKGKPYYIPGMESMDVDQYRKALQKKLKALNAPIR